MHPHGAANDQKHRQAGGSPSPAHATFAGQILYPHPSFLPTTGKPGLCNHSSIMKLVASL
jgi:hypothetical protein